VVGPFSATCSGKAYEIEEQVTNLATAGPSASSRIEMRANDGVRGGFVISNFKTSGGSYAGAFILRTVQPEMNRIHFSSGHTIGLYVTACHGSGRYFDISATGFSYAGAWLFFNELFSSADRMFVYAGGPWGIRIGSSAVSSADYWYADNITGANYALNAQNCSAVEGSYWSVDVAANGGIYLFGNKQVLLNPDVDVDNATGIGIELRYNSSVDFDDVDVTNSGSHGLFVGSGNALVDIDAGSTFSNNGGYGIKIGENSVGNREAFSSANLSGSITVASNTSGGILVQNHSIVDMDDCDGTNTGAYGLELETGSYATIQSTTGITGGTDDATIDGGTTDLSWSTHFSSNGDIAVNLENGCRIERVQ
jgi:hypothetical protein